MKVLIVDDDTISMTLVTHILNKKGYQTVGAMSAKQAIEYLDSGESIGLIISDIIMPDMDGIEFFSYIRRKSSIMHIPVIMCSADRNYETMNKVLQMGVKDYIVKPIDSDILFQKINNVLITSMKHLVDSEVVMTRLKIDHTSYKELLNTLLNTVSSAIIEMEELANTGNLDRLKFVAAALSGGARNLGAECLSGILDTIEEAKQRKDSVKAKNIIKAIERELNVLNDLREKDITLSNKHNEIQNKHNEIQKELTILRNTMKHV